MRMEQEVGGEDDDEEGDGKEYSYFLALMRKQVEVLMPNCPEERFLRGVKEKWISLSKDKKEVLAKARRQEVQAVEKVSTEASGLKEVCTEASAMEEVCTEASVVEKVCTEASALKQVSTGASVLGEVSTEASALEEEVYTEASVVEKVCTEASAVEEVCTEASAVEEVCTEASALKQVSTGASVLGEVSTEASALEEEVYKGSTEPCAALPTPTRRRRSQGGQEKSRLRLLAFQRRLTEERGLPLSHLLIQETEARSPGIRSMRQEDAALSASPWLRRRGGNIKEEERQQVIKEEVRQQVIKGVREEVTEAASGSYREEDWSSQPKKQDSWIQTPLPLWQPGAVPGSQIPPFPGTWWTPPGLGPQARVQWSYCSGCNSWGALSPLTAC